MMGFVSREALPGVYHIRDAMGVYMTLLKGENAALLVDTGYGLEDAAAYVRTLTELPVSVLLTHAHHDHALGAMWFSTARVFAQDLDAFDVYTGAAQRARVAQQAQDRGVAVPPDYMDREIKTPVPLEEGAVELGGMSAQVISCPGHTPGSAVVYVPERRLLLTGDDWNPCTWLFFPEALPAQAYRENVRALLRLPFEYVLCSHQGQLYPRAAFEDFVQGLTDEALCAARRVDMGRAIDTREAVPAPGQQFVFDFGKTGLCGRENR